MPLDTTIALQAKTPEFNPLAQALQVAQYRSQNLQANQLQQQMNSRMAIGRAFANNTQNGVVNQQGALQEAAGNPDAAYGFPEASGTSLTQQGQGINNDTGAQGLANTRGIAVAKAGISLLTNPNATGQDYMGTLRDLHKNGIIDDKTYINTVDEVMPNLNNPGQLQTLVKGMLSKLPEAMQAQYVKPVLGEVATGGATQMTSRDPLSGAMTPNASIPNTLSPGQAVGRVETVGPTGARGTVPLSSTVPSALLPPGMQGQQPTAQPAGNGRYPQQAQAGQPQQGGFLPSGLAPGVGEAANVAGQGSGTQLVADQNAAAGSGARVYQLQSALKALNEAGTVGPGTASMNNFKSFLLAQTPGDLGKYLPGIDANKIASYDEANKYLTQYASAKASSLGGGTDSKLATTLSANASTHISDLAAKDVVKANIGLERMSQAQAAAWNDAHLPESEYRTWASKFGATMDPRVFVADQLDPAHVKKLYSGMQSKEQAQFKAQYNWAVQNKYINGPQ